LLTQRVATAAVGVPLIIILILVGGAWYVAAAAAFIAMATLEFEHPHFGWLDPLSLLAAALSAGLVAAASVADAWLAVAAAPAVVMVLLAYAARERPCDASRAAWAAGGVVYVGLLGSALVLLREVDNGRDWVLLAVLSTFAADTSAYFVGRAFGRHRMAPRISPKKTWEGFFGGWAGGFAAAVALNYALGLRIEPWQIVALAATLPLAAAAGDLVESWMKRRMEIKDASPLLPGHGGVLDRLDSILFTFPLTYLFARLIEG
jgi:phosphatidate cytidylyltransferase